MSGLSNSFPRISGGQFGLTKNRQGRRSRRAASTAAVIKAPHVAQPQVDTIISPRPISEVGCDGGGDAQTYPVYRVLSAIVSASRNVSLNRTGLGSPWTRIKSKYVSINSRICQLRVGFGLRLKNIADGLNDKALASCTIKEGEKFFTKGPSAKRKCFDDQNVRFRILKRVA